MHFPYCDIDAPNFLLWVHVAILTLCGILVVSSTISQFQSTAPYGRHDGGGKGWGPPIPQRLGHVLSDGPVCVFGFLAIFLLYAGLLPSDHQKAFTEVGAPTVILVLGWLLHYVHRGWIHPFLMEYSSPTVPVGITLAGLFPNILFSYLIAAQLGCTKYPQPWVHDPRFIIGVILYIFGFIINKHADWYLRTMRRKHYEAVAGTQDPLMVVKATLPAINSSPVVPAAAPAADASIRSKYFIPHGGLFELISCPNYFGELLEWSGYALAAFSYPTLLWALFGASTFFPRSLAHHRWYKKHFGTDYPPRRGALIPFVF